MLLFSWVSRVSFFAELQTLLHLPIPWAVDFSEVARGLSSLEALLQCLLVVADFPYQ